MRFTELCYFCGAGRVREVMPPRRAAFSDSHLRLSDFSFKDSLFLEFFNQVICRIKSVGEDVKVLWTVCQGQFNLHAVVIGVGEDAVLRYVLYRRALLEGDLLPVNGEYHNEKRLISSNKGKSTAYDLKRH